MRRSPLVCAKLVLLTLALSGNRTATTTTTTTTTPLPPTYWRATLGDICQLPSLPKSSDNPRTYLECLRQDKTADRSDIGVWRLRECMDGFVYVASAKKCRSVRSVRRKDAMCRNNRGIYQFCPAKSGNEFYVTNTRTVPSSCQCKAADLACGCPRQNTLSPMKLSRPVGQAPPQMRTMKPSGCICNRAPCNCQTMQACTCQTTLPRSQYCLCDDEPLVKPQPCALATGGPENARYGGICSWMLDPLAADPECRCSFLQCQPVKNNLFCGRWQRRPCAPGTVFDMAAQICVWDPCGEPGDLPMPTPETTTAAPAVQCQCRNGGLRIGSCSPQMQCPGLSVCQAGQLNNQACTACCYYRPAMI